MDRVGNAEELNVGPWWRAAGYEERGGVIRALPGGGKPIDPWAERRAPASPESPEPYRELLALAEIEPGPATSGQVLEWVRAHGLLGLLGQQCAAATLAPSEGRQMTFTRRPEKWIGQPVRATPPLPALASWHGDGVTAFVPVEKSWGPYFPDVPAAERATYQYPLPGSSAFWHQYGEEPSAILHAGRTLAQIVAWLGWVHDPEPDPNFAGGDPEAQVREIQFCRAALASFLAPVGFALVNAEKSVQQVFSCPTLLSSYALMISLDAERWGMAHRRCLWCRVRFLAHTTKGQKFCTKKHRRDLSNQSRDRSKKKPTKPTKGSRHAR